MGGPAAGAGRRPVGREVGPAMRCPVSILAAAALSGSPPTSAQLSWVRGTSDTLRISVTVAPPSGGPHPPSIVEAQRGPLLVYSLTLGPGQPWLESAPVSVFAGSAWYTSSAGTGISSALTLSGAAWESTGTDPTLGQFDALTIPWRYGPSSSPSHFNTTIKYYSLFGAVAFEQAFMDGVPRVGTLEQPPLAHVEKLLAGLSPEAAIVTVVDAHPATLSWIGSVAGHRVYPLGVDHFGQSGDVVDLYHTYGIDSDAILDACASACLRQ